MIISNLISNWNIHSDNVTKTINAKINQINNTANKKTKKKNPKNFLSNTDRLKNFFFFFTITKSIAVTEHQLRKASPDRYLWMNRLIDSHSIKFIECIDLHWIPVIHANGKVQIKIFNDWRAQKKEGNEKPQKQKKKKKTPIRESMIQIIENIYKSWKNNFSFLFRFPNSKNFIVIEELIKKLNATRTL